MHKFKMKVASVTRSKSGSTADLELIDEYVAGEIVPGITPTNILLQVGSGHEQEFPLGAEFLVTFEPVANPLSETASASRFNPRFDVNKARPGTKASYMDPEEVLRKGVEAAMKEMSEDWKP